MSNYQYIFMYTLTVGKGAHYSRSSAVLTLSFSYLSFVLDVDICSFANKGFHCVLMTFLSCNVQGSSLIENENKVQRVVKIVNMFFKMLCYTHPEVLFAYLSFEIFFASAKTSELEFFSQIIFRLSSLG